MALVFSGAAERLTRDQHGRAWLAWHTAALPRLKKFPTLKAMLGIKRTIRAQTPEEIAASVRRMFGPA